MKSTADPQCQIRRAETAYLWKRPAAGVIDGVVMGILAIAAYLFLTSQLIIRDSEYAWVKLPAVGLFIGWLYSAGMECSRWQGRIGKIIMKLKVVDPLGRRISFFTATLRHLSKYAGALALMAGYIMIIFAPKSQGLHDKWANTLVIQK
jgi:uncharacterized RDD family membrane protein YckC